MVVKNINVGIIGCDMTEDFFSTSQANQVESFFWKKVCFSDHPSSFLKNYPHTEVVEHEDSIINDSDIELVFVSPKHLHLIKSVIDAGKSVRVI